MTAPVRQGSRNLGSGSRGLVRALLPEATVPQTDRERRQLLIRELTNPTPQQIWLVLSVLGRRLPVPSEVERLHRVARHEGIAEVFAAIDAERRHPARLADAPVDIIEGAVLVDVHDSATTRLATGVQRLARGIVDGWLPRQVDLVGWSPSRTQLRTIAEDAWATHRRRGMFSNRGVVPWNGWYTLAEVVGDVERSIRIQALAQYSGCRTMLVGADVIPLTTAETTGPKMPGVFAKYLSAASRMSVVVGISETASAEYAGWRAMLGSAGIEGPEIRTVDLAVAAREPSPESRESAVRAVTADGAFGDLPLVLCVGSHEPRKNHEAVLHAAEVLWREGQRFSLVFIGGNAWHSGSFRMRVDELKAAGRPVATISGASDDVLLWAYRLARFTVFPSVNEGFGLPIAESLVAGTPVVTTGYGSMLEVASNGGCVLVDPRDDASIATGIRSLLEDNELYARLRAEAAALPGKSWQKYADELWNILMD